MRSCRRPVLVGVHAFTPVAIAQQPQAMSAGRHRTPPRWRAWARRPSRTQGSRCRSTVSMSCIIAARCTGNRGLDLRPTDVQHVAERVECGLERAVRLRHEIDARLRRKHVVAARDARFVQRGVDSVRARRHSGPEPQLEILQRIQARAQRFELLDLREMIGDVHLPAVPVGKWGPVATRAQRQRCPTVIAISSKSRPRYAGH